MEHHEPSVAMARQKWPFSTAVVEEVFVSLVAGYEVGVERPDAGGGIRLLELQHVTISFPGMKIDACRADAREKKPVKKERTGLKTRHYREC
jgi:hypothetical protein